MEIELTIQDWGALGEMIGSIAIIISLIYLVLQIRQNTKATKVATSQAFIGIYGTVFLAIAHDEKFRDVYWRGLNGLSNLNGEASLFA